MADSAYSGDLGASVVELNAANAVDYLKRRGMELDHPRISELGGGVSNTVLLVESGAPPFVLKQALGKLRVEQEWLADRNRVFRESAALERLSGQLPRGSLPEVLFVDQENFAFAMSAAPAAAACWKDLLLRGEVRVETAQQVGGLLARIVSSTWRQADWEREFADQTIFTQLRIDPYYRATALRHSDLEPRAIRLIAESGARRMSLTHGDWSPKNFLVDGDRVMAIDFEVIHYGDPSFDTAFMLNHFLLKSFYRPQWTELYAAAAAGFWRTFVSGIPQEAFWIEQATLQHLGWLLLARVDGKSPAEYIRGPELENRVRQFAREWILSPPVSVERAIERLPFNPTR